MRGIASCHLVGPHCHVLLRAPPHVVPYRTARRWLTMPEPDSLMNLAIFLDAHAVTGDAHLLDPVQRALRELTTDNDMLLARFAAAIDLFASGEGWWHRFIGDVPGHLNLKKEGIFPLVHGVRSLALAGHVHEAGTAARIAALVQAGALTAPTGRYRGGLHTGWQTDWRNKGGPSDCGQRLRQQ